jgi:hypothetical protein
LITGGAGLGKTTFAKAIGKLFFEFGLLARDLFQIREKTDFIGQYVGQTPMKTYSTLYSALESMLFIDNYDLKSCCFQRHCGRTCSVEGDVASAARRHRALHQTSLSRKKRFMEQVRVLEHNTI